MILSCRFESLLFILNRRQDHLVELLSILIANERFEGGAFFGSW